MANEATLLVLVCKQVIFTENSILKAQRRRRRRYELCAHCVRPMLVRVNWRNRRQ